MGSFLMDCLRKVSEQGKKTGIGAPTSRKEGLSYWVQGN